MTEEEISSFPSSSSLSDSQPWSVLEKLLLVQAIHQFGEEWPAIAKVFRQHFQLRRQAGYDAPDRPSEFYSPKNCAQQWSSTLAEATTAAAAETSKRSKKQASSEVSTPSKAQEMPLLARIARELHTKRVDELTDLIRNDEARLGVIATDIKELRSGKLDAKLPMLLRQHGIEVPEEKEEVEEKKKKTEFKTEAAASKDAEERLSEKRDTVEVKLEIDTTAVVKEKKRGRTEEEEEDRSKAEDADGGEPRAEPGKIALVAVKTEAVTTPVVESATSAEPSSSSQLEEGGTQETSEASIASTPVFLQTPTRSTPASNRGWRKSVMITLDNLWNYKWARPFQHAVKEDDEPNYYKMIKRPMDLTLIKSRVNKGIITTTAEFHRDLLLMFQNAFMYNNSKHEVFEMAKEMVEYTEQQMEALRETGLGAVKEEEDSIEVSSEKSVKRRRGSSISSSPPVAGTSTAVAGAGAGPGAAGPPSLETTPASGGRGRKRRKMD